MLPWAMYNFSSAVSSWVNYVLGIPWWCSQWRMHLQCRRCGLIPGLGQSLEKKMATHLAWEILWTEEPSGLLSIRSQRIGHNLATKPPTPSRILCKGENWGKNEVWSLKSSPFVLRNWVSMEERVLVLTGRCSVFFFFFFSKKGTRILNSPHWSRACILILGAYYKPVCS